MGLVFQVYLVAMQNSIDPRQMGIATATTQFFRSMGATFGVAAFGAVLFNRFQSELLTRLGPIARRFDLHALLNAPATRHLPPVVAHDFREGLSVSLHSVFIGCMVVGAVAAAVSFLLKEKPLRTTSNMAAALSAEVGPVGEEGAQAVAESAAGR